MLKQHISFKSPSGQPMQKTLYFNLTRFEVAHDMELEKLEERLKKFQEEVILDEEDRLMTSPEIREMLGIVKLLIKHAYGIREMGPDGEEFNKEDPDIWRRFVSTGAFDGFIWYLFEDKTGQRANKFMSEVWPQEIRDAVQQANRPDIRAVKDVPLPGNIGEEAPIAPDDDGIPSLDDDAVVYDITEKDEKGLGEYTDAEFLAMTDEEFAAAVDRFRQGNNIPGRLLVLGFQRNKEVGGKIE